MRRVDTSWKMIEAILWEHAHSVYRALRKPATGGQLAGLETVLGARLPTDIRRSLCIHDGMRPSGGPCFFDGMVLLPVNRIAKEWRMRCEIHGEDDPGGCPETTDKRIKNDRWWRAGWIPFMEENGNMLLIDLDPGSNGRAGQVFKFHNSPVRPRLVLARSFADWLGAVADCFTARQFRLSEYGDIWVDDLDLA